MASLIPNSFPDTSNPAIASYNYTDIAEGTGMAKFYAAFSCLGGSILSEQALYSHNIEITGTASAVAYTTLYDLDFDLSSFNYPKTVKGTAIVGFGYDYDGNPGGNNGQMIFTIRKWDGTTETDIGTATFEKDNAADESKATFIQITLTETHFKRGEILRLNVFCRVKNAAAAATRFTIGTDPMNRDGTYIIPSTDVPTTTTKLEFYCPFKIDI